MTVGDLGGIIGGGGVVSLLEWPNERSLKRWAIAERGWRKGKGRKNEKKRESRVWTTTAYTYTVKNKTSDRVVLLRDGSDTVSSFFSLIFVFTHDIFRDN